MATIMLLWGISYLRGSSVFNRPLKLKTTYTNVSGLGLGGKVIIHGYRIGKVGSMDYDNTTGKITVTLALDSDLQLPTDSYAMIISESLISDKIIQLVPGKATTYCKDGDMLRDSTAMDLIAEVKESIIPLKNNLEKLSSELLRTTQSMNKVIGDPAQLQRIMTNVETTTGNLSLATHSLSRMDSIMKNVNTLTAMLDKNSGTLDRTLKNVAVATDTLKSGMPELRKAMTETRQSLAALNKMMADLQQGKGTAGALLTDRAVYDNLNKSLTSLEKLTTDFQQNPRRYIGEFSIFGRNTKKVPPKPAQQ